MNKKNLLNFIVIFLLVYIALTFFMPQNDQNQRVTQGDFILETAKKEFSQNETVSAKLRNNTTKKIIIKNECPDEPLNVLKSIEGQWQKITHTASIQCPETKNIVLEPQSETIISYNFWNHTLFSEIGRYKLKAEIEIDKNSGKKTIESNEFEVKKQGIFEILWTTLLYQPIYNALIALVSILPYHDLGLAIILLTIIIRTILLLPSQKALKSQRKLQELQPKIANLKEKHKDNQEMLARETMQLWKTHKVNPLGSCLPLLIQFPFLIAIFTVIQNGLNPDNSYLLYGSLREFSLLQVNIRFLNILDLTKIDYFVIPIIVGGLQFIQMKLAILKNTKKKNPFDEKKDNKKTPANEMEKANQMMIYIMPVMFAIFTASAPAGVGLYWAASTLYGIVQQFIVNNEVAKENVKVKILS